MTREEYKEMRINYLRAQLAAGIISFEKYHKLLLPLYEK